MIVIEEDNVGALPTRTLEKMEYTTLHPIGCSNDEQEIDLELNIHKAKGSNEVEVKVVKDRTPTTILYYGQTSMRNSTLTDDIKLKSNLKRCDLTDNVLYVKGNLVTVKQVHEVKSKLDSEASSRPWSYTYALKEADKKRAKYFNNIDHLAYKNELLDLVERSDMIIIRVPAYKSTGWIAMATLALHHKDNKDVLFVGAVHKLKYSSSLIFGMKYRRAETMEDLFGGNVYDQDGNVASNLFTDKANNRIRQVKES